MKRLLAGDGFLNFMKVVYNSHIVRVKQVALGEIGAIIAKYPQRPSVLKFHGPNKEKVEIPFDKWDQQGFSLPFTLEEFEIVFRNPEQKPRVDYTDQNDRNALYWGTERGRGHKVNYSRGCPMFFRENGASLDLIDLYKGGSCFLLLNGPSMSEHNPSLFKLPGIISFGVNNGAHIIRPNLWTCVDDPKRFMSSIWSDSSIMKFVPMHHFGKPIWDVGSGTPGQLVRYFPNVVGYRRNEKFVADQWLTEDTINWGNHKSFGGGRSCMVAALRIIHLLGFRKVYLVGCDFYMSETEKYFFEEQRTDGAIKGNNNSYKILEKYFTALKPVFDDNGFEVFNCNEKSRLQVFPFMGLPDAISTTAIDTSVSTYGMYVEKDDQRRHDKENG